MLSCNQHNPEGVGLETDNGVNPNIIEMTGKSTTKGATKLTVVNKSDCLETIVEATSHANDKTIPTDVASSRGIDNVKEEKVRANRKQTNNGIDDSIHVDEMQPLNVATTSVRKASNRLLGSTKSLIIQPEAVVKIYCNYDAVQV